MSTSQSPTPNSQLQTLDPGRQTLDSQSPGPLHGIRVIECGNMVSAPYAAKLMADLGAEVIKIEWPAGDASHRRWDIPSHRLTCLDRCAALLPLCFQKIDGFLQLRIVR